MRVVVFSCKIEIICGLSLRPRERHGRGHQIDVTGNILVPGNQPDRRTVTNREIPETIQVITHVTTLDRVDFQVITTGGYAHFRFVGNNPDRTGLTALTIQGALWTGQCFNPGYVVHMNIQHLVNRCHRLFIQVITDTGHRGRVVTITT